MRLSDLDSKTASLNVVILQTPSTKLMMFLEDRIKRKFRCNSDSIMSIENKKQLKDVKNLMGVNPPDSAKWFISVDLDKFYDKELVKLIKDSTTCFFFITCSKYSQFKDIKESLKQVSGVYDFYMTYMRKPDFIYLYDALTLSDNKLSTQLFNYVAQSYSSDIEAIMTLLLSLNSGVQFNSRKDISDVCGIGGNSTESFIFSLLKPISGSDKGLKTVMKNRITAGVDLCETLGYGTFYNYMAKSLLCFIEIKQLLISGVIYKCIRNLPDSYDEKTLSRYNKYLWRLKQIPTSDLLRLRQCLGDKRWNSELDFLNFLYKYYTIEALNKVS